MLEERKEQGADIPRRPEAIHLYGVDCLSTGDCLAYFSDYGPTFVEWIDDSSCNILFEDEFTAKRALIGRGKPLPPDQSAPDTAGSGQVCIGQPYKGCMKLHCFPLLFWVCKGFLQRASLKCLLFTMAQGLQHLNRIEWLETNCRPGPVRHQQCAFSVAQGRGL